MPNRPAARAKGAPTISRTDGRLKIARKAAKPISAASPPCCELSTSAHHLVAKIGEEQGYKLAESSGMDIEDAITIATRLLKGRIAKQVWRDYHKHAFARRCYADPSDMGLKALQLSDRRREQDQTEREQLQLQHTLLTRLHHGWRRGIG